MKYRLVTKDDFDGMACGILFKALKLVDSVVFVHPKEIETGKFAVTGEDITAGLPYAESAHLAFDHYSSAARPAEGRENLKVDVRASSTARVVHDYYGKEKFRHSQEELLNAVDKGFSAKLTSADILYPTGWVLLSYLIDPRTGLERHEKFRTPHMELMNELMDEGRSHSIWKLLNLPGMEERLTRYFACVEEYKEQLLRCSSVFSNLVVTDTRKEKLLYPGNKFMTYALFHECNVSLNVSLSEAGGRVVFAAGKSVLDRTCSLDIGAVMKKFGGGGHAGAGGCQAGEDGADELLESLIKELKYGLLENLYQGYFNYY
ncbi:MAG: exopolyphosphatase [Elusimicrobiota bacterium]|nr:exopolyphosphatase [Elusimicrobiota bacterium]